MAEWPTVRPPARPRIGVHRGCPGGLHYLWSGDGEHLVYATGTCQIGIANTDGGEAHLIPVLGDSNKTTNPTSARSCDPYSVSPDASRVAVDLHTGHMPDGDILRSMKATAIIDTSTGHAITLPVKGTLNAAFYHPDGTLLLRTTVENTTTLTLLAGDTIIAQAIEPPAMADALLVAHTR